MTTIPNPPSLGDSFTNDSTGVSYSYDGEKWVITSTPGSEQSDQLGEDLTALTSRVADGETVQEQIQSTISDALTTQDEIQEAIGNLEASIPSSDEFYLKTGGDINGYVYTKGSTAGYYLGSQDGDNLVSLTEKAAQEAHLQLRSRTSFKVTGYAPGDNAAFPYIDLDTSVANGLQLNRLSDPVQETDAVNKRYVDEVAKSYGVPYVYQDVTPANLSNGEFTLDSDYNIFFSRFDKDNNEIVSSASQNHSVDVSGCAKAYDTNGTLQYMMAFNEYSVGQGTNRHCKLHKNHSMRSRSLTSGATYYLADGFLLPY